MKIKDIALQNNFDPEKFSNFIKQSSIKKTSFGSAIDDADVENAVLQYKTALNIEKKEQAMHKEAEAKRRLEEEQRQKEEQRRRIEEQNKRIEEQNRRIAEQQKKAEAEEKRRKTIASMLVTSGFNFDGYTIKRYSGYISGDDAVQIDRDDLFKGNGQLLSDALVKVRIQAMKELKEAAYNLGCNAVIGVDFDYITFEPENIRRELFSNAPTHYYEPYVICVTANGNAVVIEKNE